MEQIRPVWCPHQDCIFIRSAQTLMCGGCLPEPIEHDGQFNTHRFCLHQVYISDYQVNTNDLDWFRWIFDALDGKKTSVLSY